MELSKIFSKLLTRESFIEGWKTLVASKIAMPGDIILTQLKARPVWSHDWDEFDQASLVVEVGAFPETIEMVGSDFFAGTLFDVFARSSRVVIIRCVDFDSSYIKTVINKAKTFQYSTLDIHFSHKLRKYFCSEMIRQADIEDRIHFPDYLVHAKEGDKIVTPDSLFCSKNVEVIFDSDFVDDVDLQSKVSKDLG